MADEDQRDDVQDDDDARTADDAQARHRARQAGEDAGDSRDTDDDDGQHDDEPKGEVAVLRAEVQRLRRKDAEREKERRKAEREAKRAEDDRKAEQGQWRQLAEEAKERVAELEAEIAERDRKEAEREQRATVTAVAERLNFRRPSRAYALLVDELGGQDEASDTLADEQLVDAALRRMAKAEPYLVDQQRRSGAPVGGRNGGQQPAENEHADLVFGLLGMQPK